MIGETTDIERKWYARLEQSKKLFPFDDKKYEAIKKITPEMIIIGNSLPIFT